MPSDENARLDEAMRRADDLLVGSLRREERHRARKRLGYAGLVVLAVAVCVGVATRMTRRAPSASDTTLAASPVPAASSRPAPAAATQPAVAASNLSGKLLALSNDWRQALGVGYELAAADPDAAWSALSGNWSRVASFEARQQILKAFVFKAHPRVLDVLDLGMNDPDPNVQAWAANYLRGYAFQDFAEDSSAYGEWRKQTAGKPLSVVTAEAARAYVERLKAARGDELLREARFAGEVRTGLRDVPAAREAAVAAGALDVGAAWLRDHGGEEDAVRGAANLLAALQPSEPFLRNTVLPLLTDESRPAEVRDTAARLVGRPGNAWAVEPLLGALRTMRPNHCWGVAGALGEIGDPRAIPDMIAVIAADNTYHTVYGIGYFGLSKMTGVRYDESHDGAWWTQWWERERHRFPEPARSATVPKFERKPKAAQGAAALAAALFAMLAPEGQGAAAEELLAGGDGQMKFFLVGPKAKPAPKGGYRLLLVLPGGDGSAGFKPFVSNILENALSDDYLLAQLVAPKWSEDENRIVWPTEKLRDPAMKFTTEAFIDAVVAAVGKRQTIDAKHVYALGWSSGGPPVYAAAMRKETTLAGAFVAMSVFKPAQLPPARGLDGRAFYILHSPQDFIQMRFPKDAEKTLAGGGAKTTLVTYEGGHGWRGDVFGNIRAGVEWLEKNAKKAGAEKRKSKDAAPKGDRKSGAG